MPCFKKLECHMASQCCDWIVTSQRIVHPQFNGENLLSWTTNMNQLLGSKGLLGYINGKVILPPNPHLEILLLTPHQSTLPLRTTTSGYFGTNLHEEILFSIVPI